MLRLSAFLLLCATARAEAPPSPTPPSQVPGASAEVSVALVQVEVRVQDGDGDFVAGLGVADFEVLEDGRAVPVEFVDEYGALPAGTPVAGRPVASPVPPPQTPEERRRAPSVLLIVDGANSSADSISRQKEFLADFVRSLRSSSALVAVFELRPDGVFEMRSGFSRDTGETARAIAAIKLASGGGDTRGANLQQLETLLEDRLRTCSRQDEVCAETAFQRVIDSARRLAMEEQRRATNSMESIRGILRFADHLPGAKSLVLVSEGIDPGGVSYFNAAAKLARYYAQTTALGDTQRWINATQREATVFAVDAARLEQLTEAALDSGVTTYWVNPSHSGELAAFSPERGFGSYTVGGDEIGLADPKRLLQDLAEQTGGLALTRAARVQQFYQRLSRDLSRYYVVSFTPGRDHHDGARHQLEVKTRRRGVKVRTRESYTDHVPEARIGTRIASALDFPEVFRDFPLATSWSYLAGNPQHTLRIDLAVPYRELTPRIVGDNAVNVLHFGFVVRDADGTVRKTDHPYINLSETVARFDELVRAGAHIDYRHNLELEPGRYTVTAAVLDETGDKTAAARFDVVLPARAERCLSVSPLLLAASVRKVGERVDQVRFEPDGSARYQDSSLRFSALRQFPFRGQLTGIYQIVNPSPGAEGKRLVDVFFRLFRQGSFLNQTPVSLLEPQPDPGSAASTHYFAVPYSALAPGDYRLELVARDRKTGCEAVSGAGFQVVDAARAAGEPSPPSVP